MVAFDRPAFGLTERPMPGDFPNGVNPYTADAQADLTVGLMDELGIEQAVLVGNSAGGTIAAHTALRYPERVKALVLVDAAIYGGGGSPSWARPLLTTPAGAPHRPAASCATSATGATSSARAPGTIPPSSPTRSGPTTASPCRPRTGTAPCGS